MKYQTKITVTCLCLSFLSSVIGLTFVYFETKKDYVNELRSQAISIAATIASLTNTEELKKIQGPQDVTTKGYQDLYKFLRSALDLNQRTDVFVNHVYALVPSKDNPDKMLITVSAANTPQETKPIGTSFSSAFDKQIRKHIDESYSPKTFIKNKWGLWLSGFSPIFDASGKYIGTIGIDIDAREVSNDLSNLFVIGGIAFFGTFLISYLVAYVFARNVASSISSLCELAKRIGKGDFSYRIDLKTKDECHDLEVAMYQMCDGLSQKERLRENFSRYVSSNLLEKLLSSQNTPKLEGERRKITVLFSDIRHFTTLSEHLAPEDVFHLLNDYFEQMIDAIFANSGLLDKFLGDGLLVEFGSIMNDENQEKNAVLTAIDMQKRLKYLCEKWKKEGRNVLQAGIGIHTGLAVVGNVGTEKRMEFTAIGNTIQIAFFLEDATKKLKLPILISESTTKALIGQFEFQSIGRLPLPQSNDTIFVYTLEIDEYGKS